MKNKVQSFLSMFVLTLVPGLVFAQEVIHQDKLEEIIVRATRVDRSLYEIPASVGYVDKDDIQLGKQQLGLDESLVKVPGLFMSNRYNFNQDLRISIRGFGSRASFGIRGLRMFVDGIPYTLPDGSSNIDNVDVSSTDHMEVIRGPSSSLYGTSSGGVVNLYTESGPKEQPFYQATASMGSYDYKKLQFKTGGQYRQLNYFLNASRLELDGYRDHASVEKYLINSKFIYEIDDTSDFTLTANILDKPEAEDPGGLCRNSSAFCIGLTPDRTAAQRNNLRFDAEETAEQQTIGLLYRKAFSDLHEITAKNYYVFRNFNTNLPFGYFGGPIEPSGGITGFDRFFIGGGLQYTYKGGFLNHDNRLSIGVDIDSQADERKIYTNLVDNPRVGPLTAHQDEDVFNWGVYLQNEFAITEKLDLIAGVRYDEVEFEFTDFYLSNGDQGGSISFDEWSPQGGLVWKFNDAVNFYGNISTSFETPSTREFAARGSGAGFNTDLTSQTSINYEIGIKGVIEGKTSYQLSVFRIDTTDELIPDGENDLGSDVFINAGETQRNGVEAALSFRPIPGLDISLAYTYSDFEFESFTVSGTSFAGNNIPGIPQHYGYAEIAYHHPSGLYAQFDVQAVDEVFVDNGNTDAAESYVVSNFRGGTSANIGDTTLDIFLGVSNLFDEEYIGNVRVNEGNSRFFEPAPELNVYSGLSITFR